MVENAHFALLQQLETDVALVIAVADLLERAQFKEFWARVKNNALFSGVAGFEDAIRDCPSSDTRVPPLFELIFIFFSVALGVLTKTYRTASLSLVGDVLGADADAFAKARGWKVVDSVVHLPEEPSQLKFKPAIDNIRFDRSFQTLNKALFLLLTFVSCRILQDPPCPQVKWMQDRSCVKKSASGPAPNRGGRMSFVCWFGSLRHAPR